MKPLGPSKGVVAAMFALSILFSYCAKEPPEKLQGPAGDVHLPASLGAVKERFDGNSDQPLIFVIGESHVNLAVQENVAEILSYLRGAYDVKVICAEGLNGPLPVPALHEPLMVRRRVARSELLARHIDGMTYAALAHPDMSVVGVEDMEAYDDHKRGIKTPSKELVAWDREFQGFVNTEGGKLDESRFERLNLTIERFNLDHDARSFVHALHEVFPPSSKAGEELAALQAKRLRIMKSDPLMRKRDQALASGAISAAKSNPVALVIGSLHLDGVAEVLRERGRSFVSILPPGVPEDPLLDSPAEDDAQIYDEWQKGTPTPFERWLPHLKPPSALQREPFLRKQAVLGMLAHGESLLREGVSFETVQTTIHRSGLPGFVLGGHSVIPDGYALFFTVDDRPFYFCISGQELELFQNENPDRIETGRAGNQFWALFDGSGGKKPPLPPPPSEGSSPSDGDFNQRVRAAIAEDAKSNGKRAFLVFIPIGGIVWRETATSRRSLGLSEEALLVLVNDYRNASPEVRLLAAQRLAAAALIDIDKDLLPGRRELHQIAANDILGNISLPMVAALANVEGARKFSEFPGIYTHYWEDVKRDPEAAVNWTDRPVDIKRTVVWIAPGLRRVGTFDKEIVAIEATGVRVDQPVQDGDTLVILGGKGDDVFRMNNGREISLRETAFEEAVSDAEAVVPVNVALPEWLTTKAKVLRELQAHPSNLLVFGRNLLEQIQQNSGTQSLDETLRSRAARERTQARKKLASARRLRQIDQPLSNDSEATMVRS